MLFGSELLLSLRAGEWTPQLLGQLWFELHPESLNLTQAIIQRYLIPQLWDPVVVEILLWPAWLVFAIPGVALLLLFRQRANNFAPRKYLS
ncbi:hypothetical protein [Sneathiella limimaris]|uniref:hypothetical protein n=1 Tax=Sneathiella limimaris TaxID=1964213 RepID=UPI00146BFE45|nr:hypothetical protein [Sneathiella limimaris]